MEHFNYIHEAEAEFPLFRLIFALGVFMATVVAALWMFA